MGQRERALKSHQPTTKRNKVKRVITGALCLALVAIPIESPKANIIAGICLMGITVIVAGGVVIMIKQCKPKYYCLWDMMDPAKGHWIGTATRSELIANDWAVASGPYNTVAEAGVHCPPPTNAPSIKVSNVVSGGVGTYSYTPSWIHIEESTNLVDWVEVAMFADDPTNFSWSKTNSSSIPCAYYRAWY